jgi:hypothetical protein
MKNAIIRVDVPTLRPSHYVRATSRDGNFTLTQRREQARRFTLHRAAEKIAGFTRTAMQFSVCDAPGAQ